MIDWHLAQHCWGFEITIVHIRPRDTLRTWRHIWARAGSAWSGTDCRKGHCIVLQRFEHWHTSQHPYTPSLIQKSAVCLIASFSDLRCELAATNATPSIHSPVAFRRVSKHVPRRKAFAVLTPWFCQTWSSYISICVTSCTDLQSILPRLNHCRITSRSDPCGGYRE